MINSIVITARIEETQGARYTPAGIEVFDATLYYSGKVIEAGRERTISFQFRAQAFGEVAQKLNKIDLGAEIEVSGFVAPVSNKNTRLVVHIQDFRLRS